MYVLKKHRKYNFKHGRTNTGELEKSTNQKLSRVGVPNSERFLDISYYSILLNIFFFIFFSESIHLMICLSVPGAKRPRIFIFLGRFAPFFLKVRVFRIRARVPNSEHFTSF